MGWVVYDSYGNLIKYYKKSGPARAAVTRYHKALAATGYSWPKAEFCCEYKDFEGVLLGLRDDALKMWQFCNTKIG
jgi:hypothetical protein